MYKRQDITSIDTGLKDESFRYELYKGTTKVKEGNFSDSYLTSNTVTCSKNNTNHIVLLTNESISTSKTSYTLYIWIDGANYTNPNTMMNKTFSFKLHADGEGAVLNTPLGNAVEYITNLYTNAEKEIVTNNSITYNTAPLVSLIGDRFGGNATKEGKAWESSNTQEHLNNPKSESECLTNFNNVVNCSTNYTAMGFNNQTDCENKYTEDVLNQGRQALCTSSVEIPDYTGGNIRYYGANPNNYVYFNCDDYSNQSASTCEIWRILGSFFTPSGGNQVRIIRNNVINNFKWDSLANEGGWPDAGLHHALNYDYINKNSGACSFASTQTCDFSSTGLKNDATRNAISDFEWLINPITTELISAYPNDIYENEINSGTTTWTGRVGIMYLSDYAYATDLSKCSNVIADYSNSSCSSNNWLKSSSDEWTISNYNNNYEQIYYIGTDGCLLYTSDAADEL